MLDQVVYVAAVSVLGVFEQGLMYLKNVTSVPPAYFSLQVIQARRKYSVSPPSTVGPPEFERVFRAQANCSEYFPIFLTVLWVSGIFFSQAISSFLGLLYLFGRYKYFQGYGKSALGRLAPLYFSAKILWALLAFSTLGVLNTLNQLYFDVDLLQLLNRFFM